MSVYNWLCLLGVPSMLVSLFAFIKAQWTVNKAMKAGLQAILRDRLLQSYRYFSGKGYAEPEDRTNFENMWKQYEALGENGVMEDIHNKFMALPVYELKGDNKK